MPQVIRFSSPKFNPTGEDKGEESWSLHQDEHSGSGIEGHKESHYNNNTENGEAVGAGIKK